MLDRFRSRLARRNGGSAVRPAETCPSCGRPLDAKDIHYRLLLPEAVLRLPDRDDSPEVQMSHPSPAASVFMDVLERGAFVRALLPVRLTDGFSLTLGLWIEVEPDHAARAREVWWEPEYADLAISGRLANRIEPWGLLGTPVEIRAVDVDELPVCVGSTDPLLRSVLADEWDHEEVLAAYP